MKSSTTTCLAVLLLTVAAPLPAASLLPPPASAALAQLDLASDEGARTVQGQWRYSDARVVEIPFRAAGPDQQPTGAPLKTLDIAPQAGAAEFDDSRWDAIAANSLGARRGSGKLSFNWYRLALTVPSMIGEVATRGATLVFEATLDDYAEIWVDGELPRAAAQSGGSVVAGWNAPNRLVIGRNVQPGQQIQLAVFGMNGPISAPPTNFIYFKSARLEVHRGTGSAPYAVEPHEVNVQVVRLDPALDAIVPPNPKVFALAEGFQFTEGPVWVSGRASRATLAANANARPWMAGQGVGDEDSVAPGMAVASPDEDGYLLFSDPNANTIYRWSDGEGLRVFRTPSGYSGSDIGEYRQPGSNGLTFDRQGRLTIDQHGNRRVIRVEADGSETVLADRHEGKRLNSPNDLVYKSDGAIYFTDPFFGLPKFDQDPRKELPYQGVYRAQDGVVTLLTKELSGPNGIAFSPDEKFLYVGNWDDHRKVVMRYPVKTDGSLGKGSVFADLTPLRGEDAIDGVKVDVAGNVYVSGPGGLHVYSAASKHLGTILTPRHAHNFAWGDADGKTLYLCARDRLYRMRLNISGLRPAS